MSRPRHDLLLAAFALLCAGCGARLATPSGETRIGAVPGNVRLPANQPIKVAVWEVYRAPSE